MMPMMFGAAWLLSRLFFLLLVVALIAMVRGQHRGGWRQDRRPFAPEEVRRERAPLAPEDILRERLARGEIGRDEYREVLVEFLKDRYVRGELTLDEYEARLSLLMRDGEPAGGRGPVSTGPDVYRSAQ